MKKQLLLLLLVSFLAFQGNAQSTVLVDFGGSDNLSESPWNNITSPHSDTIIALIDDAGNGTSVTLAVVDSFAWINKNGFAPDGIDFPETATGDSFFGHTGFFSGGYVPTGAVELSGLTVGEVYNFTFFASREANDNREAMYELVGMTTESTLLNAASNSADVATASLMPDADGKIRINVSPGPNNNHSLEFFYLGAMRFTTGEAVEMGDLLVDFGGSGNLSESPWNNITSPHSDTIIALIDDAGNGTSVTLAVVDSFAWINNNGFAPDGIDFPETATGDSFFGHTGFFSGKEVPTGAVELAGLTVGEVYNFTFFASREASDNREATYELVGMSTAATYLNAASNAAETAAASMMPDADGKIRINVSPGPNNNHSLEFFYLGAMRITTDEVVIVDGDLLIDFEDGGIIPQKMAIFGQGTVTSETGVVDNPNPTGDNTSARVYSMCKGPGAAEWGGLWFDIDSTESVLNLDNGTTLCIDVMMPVNGIVQLKVEQFDTDNSGNETAIKMDYTAAGEWQQVCYDFTGTNAASGGDFRRIAVFPNRGEQPAEEECYFVDNITQSGEGVPVTLLEGDIIGDWETDDTSPTANAAGTGVTTTKVDNPSSDEVNSSDNVLGYCKNETSTEPFVGMTILVDTLDVTGDTAQVYISYYAAEANTVRMTLKGATDGSADVNIDAEYTTPGEWAQLVFDLRLPGVDGLEAAGHIYQAIKLAPDYGNVPASETCYYLDNILKNTNGTGVLRELISTTIGFSSDHTIFKGFIDVADMSSSVNAVGTTVFAPTDAAINALSSDEREALDNNVDGALITFILLHTTHDSLPTALMNEDRLVITRSGRDIQLSSDGTIGGAAVSEGDVVNSNGILHFVDAVMTATDEPAEIVIDDFESDNFYPGWFGFDQGPDSTTNIYLVPNPSSNDVNNSAQVMQFIKFPTAWNSWQGFALKDMERPLNFMGTLDEVCVDVLLPAKGQLRMKFTNSSVEPVTGADSNFPRYNFDTEVANEWVTICNDITEPSIQEPFRPLEGDIWNNMALFFNYVYNKWPEELEFYYFDNFVLKGDGVGTNNISQLENFSMFPNPTNDVLSIKSDTPIYKAVVFDLMGREVMSITNPTNTEINVSSLNGGLYLVDFYTENNKQLGTAKFIKQ